MSTQLSNEPGFREPRSAKQPPSVYTVMLLLSMLFMLVAVVMMFIERERWAPDYYKTNTAKPNVMLQVGEAKHWA